jgi:hypothetical protein
LFWPLLVPYFSPQNKKGMTIGVSSLAQHRSCPSTSPWAILIGSIFGF